MADPEPRLDVLRAGVSRLLERNVFELVRIGGGRNSQVYRAVDEASRRVALKVYYRHDGDNRDRLSTEFDSLTYLWGHGFRNVPRPIAVDPEMSFAVYEYIEGEKMTPANATIRDLDFAAEFLGRLVELSRLPESRKLGPASEACFSVQIIVENIQHRLRCLSECEGEDGAVVRLRAFLANELMPALDRMSRWSQARLENAGLSFEGELAFSERTLSPSDFGFHNAIKRVDGRMIFLDFEYFGWDDPAKMIADFLLHPAMSLSSDFKGTFTTRVLSYFSDYPGLIRRVESVYPLFGLKWCLILLNEFLPAPFLRRQFAATTGVDRSALQLQQLDKAKQLLKRVTEEYERFPCHG